MKAYLASRYTRRDELRTYAKLLEQFGVEITSRWLDEAEPLQSEMGDHSDEFYVKTAAIDLEDVDAADVLIFFSEDPLVGTKRGGRHFEHGYAYAKKKPIFVIGPKENVFHYSPGVHHYGSLDEFITLHQHEF
jgi:nucleoside 2-deoxyribosyltransferase